MLSAGVRAPRDFMAPNTCDGTYCCGEALQPDVGLATSHCGGAGTATAVVLVLLSVAVVLWLCSFASGGRFVSFSDGSSVSTRETLADHGEHVY
jgi:hypothetical protein